MEDEERIRRHAESCSGVRRLLFSAVQEKKPSELNPQPEAPLFFRNLHSGKARSWSSPQKRIVGLDSTKQSWSLLKLDFFNTDLSMKFSRKSVTQEKKKSTPKSKVCTSQEGHKQVS